MARNIQILQSPLPFTYFAGIEKFSDITKKDLSQNKFRVSASPFCDCEAPRQHIINVHKYESSLVSFLIFDENSLNFLNFTLNYNRNINKISHHCILDF